MAIKKFCFSLLLHLSLLWILPSYAQLPVPLGQTLQISTHFSCVIGAPTWLLIIRDMDTGQVIPYMYDILGKDNFWIAFTSGRSYVITVSDLKFGPCTIIHNFCHLEDGIISGKSMLIRLSGRLTPNRRTISCHARKYRDMSFPIVTGP